MTHDGNDCAICQNSYESCRCIEAKELLNGLYGWSIEEETMRLSDVRTIATLLERREAGPVHREGK